MFKFLDFIREGWEESTGVSISLNNKHIWQRALVFILVGYP
jgi:hypothetical protein